MSADPLRRAALLALVRVGRGDAADAVLDAALERTDARERAALAELVRGTLQWQGRYDHLIARFSRRAVPRDPRLLALLRLALHQMLAVTSVPAYAAIHQAGELCRREVGAGKVGFVNGMLQAVRRAVLGEGDAVAGDAAAEARLTALFDDLGPGSPAWLAAWHSHPAWLVEKWCAAYGTERAAAVCAWNNLPPATVLHVLAPHDPETAARSLEESGCPTRPGRQPRSLVLVQALPRARLRAALEDVPQVIVQDAAVQEATAWLAAGGSPPGPVADLCAAPGGKTAHLAALWPGVPCVAMDVGRGRMRRLRDTVRRTGTPALLVRGDGRCPPLAREAFGAVLLDGPCSGTGVLRRHPDGRWRLQPQLPARRGELLLELAAAAGELLAPGGRLLYATCSLEEEENAQVVARLRERCPHLVPAPDADGRWQRQWLPGEADGDGFYAARLARTSAAAADREASE